MKNLLLLMVVSGPGVAFAQPASGAAAAPQAVDPAAAPAPAAPGVIPPGATPPGATPPTAEPGAPDPIASPGFVVIDPLDGSSRAGIGISYLGLDGDSLFGNDLTLLRAEAHVRYVDRRSGLGGYAQLPFAYARASGNGQSDTVTDVGDLEVGGIFAPRLGSPDFGLVLHAGITLPTGEKGGEAEVGTLASVAALPTFYNALPQATTVKLGISPMFRSGNVFVRLDLGFDGNIDADHTSAGNGIHFNAGVGVDLGTAAVMLESENLTILGLEGRDSTTVNAAAVSARLGAGAMSPYLAVILPIDQDERDILDFAVRAGVDIKL